MPEFTFPGVDAIYLKGGGRAGGGGCTNKGLGGIYKKFSFKRC